VQAPVKKTPEKKSEKKSEKKPAKTALAAASKPAAPTSAAGTGGYGIQLGAFKNGAAAANKRWAHLAAKYPKVLNG
jgi:cell division protein FtsN